MTKKRKEKIECPLYILTEETVDDFCGDCGKDDREPAMLRVSDCWFRYSLAKRKEILKFIDN